MLGPSRILERDPLDAAVAQRPAQDREALGEPGADHRVLWLGRRRASAGEVAHQLVAQLGCAAGVARCQATGTRLRAWRYAQRTHPGVRAGTPRGRASPERSRSSWACDSEPAGHRRALDAGRRRDPRRRALAGGQIALGGQLGVGLEHHPARDAELRRERPGRWKPRTRARACRCGPTRAGPARAARAGSRPSRGRASRADRARRQLAPSARPQLDLNSGPVAAYGFRPHHTARSDRRTKVQKITVDRGRPGRSDRRHLLRRAGR